VIPISLWLLATLDAAFAGYREAAGRNALINKRSYYVRAMLRAALFGQLAVAITGGIILVLLSRSDDPQLLLADLNNVGIHMLFTYVWYALLIILAFLVRLMPSVDFRSITSTVVFGPLTLVRPVVAVAGIAWGVIAAPRIETLGLGLFVLILMLSIEPALGWIRDAQVARLKAHRTGK
jgi:hypothetical protein